MDISFFRRHARLIAAGMLLTFGSAFGQTYFIALFAGHFRSEFGLSHGDYGALYMIATLASAGTLLYAGALADRISPAKLGAAVLLALAGVCVLVAAVPAWWALLPAFFGLRLFGQGMATHVAITAMAKWFDAHRGRAISMASMGHPLGEATLPLIAVGLTALIGWRTTWLVAAGFLALIAAPLLVVMLSRTGPGPVEGPSKETDTDAQKADWNRREVLGDPLFYTILIGILAPSFIGTGVLFHQVHIVETKGWTLATFAAGFPLYAAFSIVVGLAAGWATDRWGAWRLLPIYLIPLTIGLVILAYGSHPIWGLVFLVTMGTTFGLGTAFLGALWVELYGRENVGAIRSLYFAGMVFMSALSPFVMGWAIDNGITVETQLLWMAAYTALSVPFYLALSPVFGRRQAA